jgi:hypothetical protein
MKGIHHGFSLHEGEGGRVTNGWVYVAVFAELQQIEDFCRGVRLHEFQVLDFRFQISHFLN